MGLEKTVGGLTPQHPRQFKHCLFHVQLAYIGICYITHDCSRELWTQYRRTQYRSERWAWNKVKPRPALTFTIFAAFVAVVRHIKANDGVVNATGAYTTLSRVAEVCTAYSLIHPINTVFSLSSTVWRVLMSRCMTDVDGQAGKGSSWQ